MWLQDFENGYSAWAQNLETVAYLPILETTFFPLSSFLSQRNGWGLDGKTPIQAPQAFPEYAHIKQLR
jgi:hypothetical protein